MANANVELKWYMKSGFLNGYKMSLNIEWRFADLSHDVWRNKFCGWRLTFWRWLFTLGKPVTFDFDVFEKRQLMLVTLATLIIYLYLVFEFLSRRIFIQVRFSTWKKLYFSPLRGGKSKLKSMIGCI